MDNKVAIAYGGNANTLARKDQIPLEEAQKIVDNYMKGFPGVAVYQNNARKRVMKEGYIDGCPEVGYRTYIHDFENLKSIKEKTKKEGFWERYRVLKQKDPFNEEVLEIKDYFKRKSEIERASVNYRIQSRGSAIFKIASANFFKWIVDNDLFNKVKMCIPAHDEFDIEAPDDIALKVAAKLKEYMINAGKFICRKAPLDAEVSLNEDGNLPVYWIH